MESSLEERVRSRRIQSDTAKKTFKIAPHTVLIRFGTSRGPTTILYAVRPTLVTLPVVSKLTVTPKIVNWPPRASTTSLLT